MINLDDTVFELDGKERFTATWHPKGKTTRSEHAFTNHSGSGQCNGEGRLSKPSCADFDPAALRNNFRSSSQATLLFFSIQVGKDATAAS
jgi:hypothetical protein